MGAAYLCAEAGISTAVISNQAAYVAGWLKKLRRRSQAPDPRSRTSAACRGLHSQQTSRGLIFAPMVELVTRLAT